MWILSEIWHQKLVRSTSALPGSIRVKRSTSITAKFRFLLDKDRTVDLFEFLFLLSATTVSCSMKFTSWWHCSCGCLIIILLLQWPCLLGKVLLPLVSLTHILLAINYSVSLQQLLSDSHSDCYRLFCGSAADSLWFTFWLLKTFLWVCSSFSLTHILIAVDYSVGLQQLLSDSHSDCYRLFCGSAAASLWLTFWLLLTFLWVCSSFSLTHILIAIDYSVGLQQLLSDSHSDCYRLFCGSAAASLWLTFWFKKIVGRHFPIFWDVVLQESVFVSKIRKTPFLKGKKLCILRQVIIKQSGF